MINSINLETKEIRIDGGIYKLGEISEFLGNKYIAILCPICGKEVGMFDYNDGDIIEADYSDGWGPEYSFINAERDENSICSHLNDIEDEGREWMERKEVEETKIAEEKKPINSDMAALFAGISFDEEDD